MFGYFPTYQLGNVLSVQIWERLTSDLPDAYEQVEQGSFGEIHEWLREHLYRHGRKFTPAETTERLVGGPIDPEPYLAYLAEKNAASRVRQARDVVRAWAAVPAGRDRRRGSGRGVRGR